LLYAFAPTGLAGDYANLTPAPIDIPNYVHGVAGGDFDGDGKLDVLIANEGVDGNPPRSPSTSKSSEDPRAQTSRTAAHRRNPTA
jgi:hypothetical protein